jgi:hypothetical protein
MKDLDFDELDRAVNSLMTNVPKSTPSASDDKEKTLDITPTLEEGSQPVFDKVEKTATAAVTPQSPEVPSSAPASPPAAEHAAPRPGSVSLPAARRGGRFMDVVHPSSDMKKTEVPSHVSRQGSTVEPLKGSTISEMLPPKPDMPTQGPTEPTKVKDAESVVEPVSEPTQVTEPSSAPSDWPDPLDVAPVEMSEKKDDELPAPEVANDTVVVEPEEEMPAPLTSPFLPDTKVEKRPLGTAKPDTLTEEPEISAAPHEEKEPKTVDDPNDQLPADPTEIETPLPEELQGDLMAVEADTTHEQVKQAHDAATIPMPSEKNAPVVSSPVADKQPVSEPAIPSGPTSIPQQYHEEPSTGDQRNGAIYDTDSYHQPLAHPAKKKSGWMLIVWIVLVLLVGAGGGAALYFLGVV